MDDIKKNRSYFRWISEPRYYNFLVALSYAIFGIVAGLFSFIDQQNLLVGHLGIFAATAWTVFAISAGVFGTPAALLGLWQLERFAIGCYLLSASLIMLGIWYSLYVKDMTYIDHELLYVSAGAILSLTPMYLKRFSYIYGADLDPLKLMRD